MTRHLVLTLLTTVFFTLPVSSEGPAWPQENSDIPPDARLHFGKLENGLRYVIMPHPEPPNRVSLRLYVHAGSLMETDEQRGLAHFLEHMAFNGTKQFEGTAIVEFLQRLGLAFGPDINAHTSFDETVYKLDLPDIQEDTLNQGFRILRDWADGMLLDAGEIDKERGVILKEKLGHDSIQFRMMEAEFAFLLPDSLLPKRIPIGTENVINNAPRARFVEFYENYYTADRMVLVVVGDIAKDPIESLISSTFKSMKAPGTPAADPNLGTIDSSGLLTNVYREPEAPATSVSITTLRPHEKKPDTEAERIAEFPLDVANAIINRRLSILAKKPDAPFTSGSAYATDFFQFADIASMELSCQPEHWQATFETAETELRRAVEHGFTEAELAEARAEISNRFERAVETAPTEKAPNLANEIVASLGQGEVYSSPEDDLRIAEKALADLAVAACREALQQRWDTENIKIMVSGNVPDDVTDEAIAKVFAASRAKEVAPPETTAEQEFAYREFGPVGQIVSRTEIEDLGITQLVFANGVRVNLKPTDFRKNTIMLTARFGAGKLSQPKDKPGIDVFASSTFEAAGLEEHSADDLQRLFAGKNVGVSFGVSDDAFSLSGRTTPEDLPDQLQLMCAHFVAAGYRSEAEQRFRKMVPMIGKQLESTPEGVFQAKVISFLHSGDPRFGIPPLEVLSRRDLTEVKAWVDPALKSGPLEFSAVGEFEVEPMIRALQQTFGALPDRMKEKPSYDSERKVAFPTGLREKQFPYDSKIDKSITLVAWPTTDRRDHIAEARRLTVLATIVDDRLRKEIREELGEAYSPMARSEGSDVFPGFGYVFAMSPGAPDKAEQVAGIIVKIGADLAAAGTNADELERAINPVLTSLKEQRRNNDYWLGSVLSSCQEMPARLEWARTIEDDLRSITVEDINPLAKKYLSEERSLAVIITTKP